MIRVLLADDQSLVRAGFRMILGAEPDIEVVGEAADGREAVALARAPAPDVVLMDIRMPEVDGIAATRQIARPEGGPPAVLVLTTFDLDAYVYEALRAGASGFLLKDAPEEQLVAGIRIVADGASLFAPTVTRRLVERFTGGPPRADGPVARRAHAARGRDPHADRPRSVQRRDRRLADRLAAHGQEPRRPRPRQARAARPRPGGRARVRIRARAARVGLAAW